MIEQLSFVPYPIIFSLTNVTKIVRSHFRFLNPLFSLARLLTLHKCEGTSAEQALKNHAIRDRLTNYSDVVGLFTTYTLEDGGIVKIDKQLAFDRVRTCMNTLKKTRGCSLNSTSADANKENEHEPQVGH